MAPGASASREDPIEGDCAVTPGGWGAPPNGDNFGQLLHDHFDDVFGAQLVVGNLVFDDAQDVTDAMPYTGPTGSFKSHAVALAISMAFGDAGLLNGTISDQTESSTNSSLDGKTAQEILQMAEDILNSDPTPTAAEYGDLVAAMSDFNDASRDGFNGCHFEPLCPGGLTAIPQANGSIQLDWDAVTGADEYVVYRAVGAGPFVELTTTTSTDHNDATTAVGQTYSYIVTARDGELESDDCEAVVATAVPFFGAPLLVALALVGSVVAYARFARKR